MLPDRQELLENQDLPELLDHEDQGEEQDLTPSTLVSRETLDGQDTLAILVLLALLEQPVDFCAIKLPHA